MYNGSQVIILAAHAKHRLIANESGIPWKDDPRFDELITRDIGLLRQKIQDSSVVLGRKTYEVICAIPTDPIQNNWNARVVVMTRDPDFAVEKRFSNSLSL